MAVHGVGVDVVDLARFAESLERTPTLRQRLLTPAEAELSLESMAGRFAAKEAFVKALRAPAGMSWTDIEVVVDDRGAPSFVLSGQAEARAHELGIVALHLSIAHDGPVATAFVVAEVA
ncbi:holo-ACP synthase [Aeromicrobium alkaliterrae]|uniref:Holo-[acyl-carrier-protein] synthase n=1 Tax=Aeromicrobium alkaliterrae TaxID=302168 RepID=A0ABP4WI11_9ACTN